MSHLFEKSRKHLLQSKLNPKWLHAKCQCHTRTDFLTNFFQTEPMYSHKTNADTVLTEQNQMILLLGPVVIKI
jgi:hypothetical protein